MSEHPGTESTRRLGLTKVSLAFVLLCANALIAQTDPQEEEVIHGVEAEGCCAELPPGTQELTDLDLEDLLQMEIEVTSVSRSAQRFFSAPAAIDVITSDEIQRSGAQEFPDLLRNVAGMNVARISRSRWGIAARGFNSRLSNKLLVQQDGTSLYSPFFSGVLWESQEFFLENIERIEVIRGPGGSVWGANAVNGIINIISKSAHDTHGVLLKITGETDGPGSAVFRYGAPIDEDESWSLQLRAKGLMKDGYPLANGGTDEEDSWHALRVGFRVEGDLGGSDDLLIDGELLWMESSGVFFDGVATPPYLQIEEQDIISKGGTLKARWRKEIEPDNELKLLFNYNYRDHTTILDYAVHTIDLDFQHQFRVGESHQLVWGLGYRLISDQTRSSRLAMITESQDTHLFSAFVQDAVSLSEELRLSLGIKLEHNHFTGFEYQPSIRLAWTPDENQTLWAAVSRAIHTPARFERSVIWDRVQVVPPSGAIPPVAANLRGDPNLDVESVLAFELGYRFRPHRTLVADIATFLNLYDGVQDVAPSGMPVPGLLGGNPALILPMRFNNGGEGDTYGIELDLRWRPLDWLSVDAYYAFLDVNVELQSSGDTAPKHTAQLRLGIDPLEELQLNTSLYAVDRIGGGAIPGYLRWDANLQWQIDENFRAAVGVHNLLDNRHPELPDYNAPTWEVRRLVWLSLEARF